MQGSKGAGWKGRGCACAWSRQGVRSGVHVTRKGFAPRLHRDGRGGAGCMAGHVWRQARGWASRTVRITSTPDHPDSTRTPCHASPFSAPSDTETQPLRPGVATSSSCRTPLGMMHWLLDRLRLLNLFKTPC